MVNSWFSGLWLSGLQVVCTFVHDILFVPYHQIFYKYRPTWTRFLSFLSYQTIGVELWSGKLIAELAESRFWDRICQVLVGSECGRQAGCVHQTWVIQLTCVSVCACVKGDGVEVWTVSLLSTVFGTWAFFSVAISLSWLFKHVHYWWV